MKAELIGLLLACLLVACTSQSNTQSAGSPTPAQMSQATTAPVATSTERPLPAESNPPGDIPDSQAFVTYANADYSIDSPEGWARSVRGPNVKFVDKFDGMSVTIAEAPARSHAPDATRAAIDALQRGAHAGRDFQISPTKLPGGPAVVVTFTSNSDPDPVTGKRVRLENRAIIFERPPKTATILLWAPLGADNVDQWNRLGASFRWR